METLLILIVLGTTAWFFFKSGKGVGSRKGYHVGRRHGRRRH